MTVHAPTLSESRRLRAKVELVLPLLLAASRRLRDHPRIRELYPEYLVLMHQVIRASVPLMDAARARGVTMDGDEVARRVADYCEHHILEETGHDDWLLEDLAALGVDPMTVVARPPSPTVAALVGSQYYWIRHVHPVGLLGYITLLEGYPPTSADIEPLMRGTGYGSEAFRTLALHAELDPHHGQELDDVLDSLALTDDLRSLTGLSAITSVQLMTQALDEVVTKYD